MKTSSYQQWHSKKKSSLNAGGPEKKDLQHAAQKKTARERISLLLDAESFEETDQLGSSPFLSKPFYTDGVVTGFGTIQGRTVALYAQDFTLRGGSVGKQHAQKICKIMDMAAKIGCPIIGLIDSGGARIEEGIHSLAGFGDIFLRNTRYSGVIPQITLILGPCAGGAVYSPALTDFIFTVKGISQLFITGPQVIQEVLHQTITKEELGGAQVHASKSGVVHSVSDTEEECFAKLKQLLAYLPNNYLDAHHHLPAASSCQQPFSFVSPNFTFQSSQTTSINQLSNHEHLLEDQSFFSSKSISLPSNEKNTQYEYEHALAHTNEDNHHRTTGQEATNSHFVSHLMPSEGTKPYNIKDIINALVDSESFFELQESFAGNIVTGFARFAGRAVGIVANQPLIKAGTLDINASCKAARFITFCDNFSIPIISLVDIPGFLPGIDQEHQGIIRHGAKLLYAYANATVPKITVILRKAFGGAYIVMGSKHLGADFNFAWPQAEIAVMGAASAVQILQSKALKESTCDEERAKLQKKFELNYQEEFLNPFTAAQWGYIDAIIEPDQTRKHLIRALAITQQKVEVLPKRKKGNSPL